MCYVDHIQLRKESAYMNFMTAVLQMINVRKSPIEYIKSNDQLQLIQRLYWILMNLCITFEC